MNVRHFVKVHTMSNKRQAKISIRKGDLVLLKRKAIIRLGEEAQFPEPFKVVSIKDEMCWLDDGIKNSAPYHISDLDVINKTITPGKFEFPTQASMKAKVKAKAQSKAIPKPDASDAIMESIKLHINTSITLSHDQVVFLLKEKNAVMVPPSATSRLGLIILLDDNNVATFSGNITQGMFDLLFQQTTDDVRNPGVPPLDLVSDKIVFDASALSFSPSGIMKTTGYYIPGNPLVRLDRSEGGATIATPVQENPTIEFKDLKFLALFYTESLYVPTRVPYLKVGNSTAMQDPGLLVSNRGTISVVPSSDSSRALVKVRIKKNQVCFKFLD